MEDDTTQVKKEEIRANIIQDKIKQEKNKKLIKKIFIYFIIIIIIAILIYIPVNNSKKPGKYDDFAKCLTEKGAKEYGAFWCPNCARQKELFGKSFKYVTYIECDARGSNPQPELCQEKKIKGYPTWEYNGTFIEGTQSLEELSNITGCALPLGN